MNVDDLAKLAGVLGFFISLATFVLTRWERRLILDFGLEGGESADFDSNYENSHGTVNLTITNLGAQAALLDLRTLEAKCNGNALDIWREDFWGKQQREILLKPNDSQMFGIPYDTFVKQLKVKPSGNYDNETFYRTYPVRLSVKTTDGKVIRSKKLKFWEAVGEFHRD